jgi:hypothetical protein
MKTIGFQNGTVDFKNEAKFGIFLSIAVTHKS